MSYNSFFDCPKNFRQQRRENEETEESQRVFNRRGEIIIIPAAPELAIAEARESSFLNDKQQTSCINYSIK